MADRHHLAYYKPSFALNRRIPERAEHHGFAFALSIMKLRVFGGPSEYWDHNPEPFALMAGLAAVTSRIRLFASVAVLALPPPITARMSVTIDSISGGRFGANIVSSWQTAEYEQMGLWPIEAHFARRYDYCAGYVQAMQGLWSTGRNLAALVLVMVIADETDAAAIAKWEHYKTGVDHEALAWRHTQASAKVIKAETDPTTERFLHPENQLPTHMPTLVGSYATIAGLLDTIGAMPGGRGAMLTFDDFERGVEQFGTRIQPLMQSRAGVPAGVS